MEVCKSQTAPAKGAGDRSKRNRKMALSQKEDKIGIYQNDNALNNWKLYPDEVCLMAWIQYNVSGVF